MQEVAGQRRDHCGGDQRRGHAEHQLCQDEHSHDDEDSEDSGIPGGNHVQQ
jgi:hypothetical protein